MTDRKSFTYQLQSSDDVDAALRQLPGWSGSTERLVRTVVSGNPDALLEQVSAIEAEMDHHAKAERSDAGVTFTVWTHSKGGVTDADLELARRISAVADALGGVGTEPVI